MMSDVAYVGLGSNLNDPSAQLLSALSSIHKHAQICIQGCSHLYASEPMGPKDQPEFVNAVCKVTTSLTPIELLDALQVIENEHGRKREGEHWGPRTLDLDILLFNNITMSNDRLTLPHYDMVHREFVLVPLFELAPDMLMQDGRNLATWVAKCSLNGLRRLSTKIDYSSIAA